MALVLYSARQTARNNSQETNTRLYTNPDVFHLNEDLMNHANFRPPHGYNDQPEVSRSQLSMISKSFKKLFRRQKNRNASAAYTYNDADLLSSPFLYQPEYLQPQPEIQPGDSGNNFRSVDDAGQTVARRSDHPGQVASTPLNASDNAQGSNQYTIPERSDNYGGPLPNAPEFANDNVSTTYPVWNRGGFPARAGPTLNDNFVQGSFTTRAQTTGNQDNTAALGISSFNGHTGPSPFENVYTGVDPMQQATSSDVRTAYRNDTIRSLPPSEDGHDSAISFGAIPLPM
ncbi:hypothetical protein Hypma_010714 [Hypsizygus marmoreus]|uniref:Uncharacterized protein n=1 Tax=Hypsizygus marmoreus TaxID=39966 RepID=A0A369JRZ5_HYPMA|nr:hypothetical protein Hypma_010714 [Hypsizygus marmoreus]